MGHSHDRPAESTPLLSQSRIGFPECVITCPVANPHLRFSSMTLCSSSSLAKGSGWWLPIAWAWIPNEMMLFSGYASQTQCRARNGSINIYCIFLGTNSSLPSGGPTSRRNNMQGKTVYREGVISPYVRLKNPARLDITR